MPASLKTIGCYAFQYCHALTSIVIPDTVEKLDERAFSTCHGLTTLTIGQSVSSIGIAAFEDCYNIGAIYCRPTTPPSTGWQVFSTEIYNKATLNVPTGSIDAYREASTWKNFLSMNEFSGVDDIQEDSVVNQKIVGYYNLQGVMLSEPSDGVNIVVYSNGVRRKVICKK